MPGCCIFQPISGLHGDCKMLGESNARLVADSIAEPPPTFLGLGFWDGKQEWEFTTKPGERAYFRVLSGDYQFNVVGTSYNTSKTIRVDGVPEEQATRELQGLHLSQ